jgi:hypothetical protein
MKYIRLLIAVFLLSGLTEAGAQSINPISAGQKFRGVTMLQTKEVGFDSPLSDESFYALARTGANAVVFIPFMHQAHPQSPMVEKSDSVRDDQLISGIRRAHAARLRVILKPQILVENSWAGMIEMRDDAEWRAWFDNYTQIILHYARIAQNEGAEVVVIGTELRRTDHLPYWRDLIKQVRAVYGGRLTYAAHNQDGIVGFYHWDLLDELGVTLYPPLGNSADTAEMRSKLDPVIKDLASLSGTYKKPVLILEIGIPSGANTQNTPWERPKGCEAPADARLQAAVIDLWLSSLNQPWVSGVFVWDWHSDPYAGGRNDTDFTVQNKPAQGVLRCHWLRKCLPVL